MHFLDQVVKLQVYFFQNFFQGPSVCGCRRPMIGSTSMPNFNFVDFIVTEIKKIQKKWTPDTNMTCICDFCDICRVIYLSIRMLRALYSHKLTYYGVLQLALVASRLHAATSSYDSMKIGKNALFVLFSNDTFMYFLWFWASHNYVKNRMQCTYDGSFTCCAPCRTHWSYSLMLIIIQAPTLSLLKNARKWKMFIFASKKLILKKWMSLLDEPAFG